MESIEPELVIKSLVFMAEGVAQTIGENGARAAMRQAGHRAASDLIEAIPLRVPVGEAIERACPLLEALGFCSSCVPLDPEHIAVEGDILQETLALMGNTSGKHPARYYMFGLLEGFVDVMSHCKIGVLRSEHDGTRDLWMLKT